MIPCHRGSSPASPLDNDKLLGEVLLRLPPLPSSLPRASAICQGWRCLTTDAQFLRRFRAHHREEGPPVLGFFLRRHGKIVFRSSILDRPDRIPPKRFDLGPSSSNLDNFVLDCRYGRVLVHDYPRKKVIVCDPSTSEQHHLSIPVDFKRPHALINGAVLCATVAHDHVHGSCDSSPFKVVLMSTYMHDIPPIACVYCSESGTWGNLISATEPFDDFYAHISVTLIDNVLYWVYMMNYILAFDLARQTLAVIKGPPGFNEPCCSHQIIKLGYGDVGLAVLSKARMQIWQRKANHHGVATWLPWKTVDMHIILGISPLLKRNRQWLRGYDEDTDAIYLYMHGSVYMVQLKSMQYKKLYECGYLTNYHPFKSFGVPGAIAGGCDGAEVLHDALG
ncbi:hypothetical protein VPH35_057237 [Triticum aestivum]